MRRKPLRACGECGFDMQSLLRTSPRPLAMQPVMVHKCSACRGNHATHTAIQQILVALPVVCRPWEWATPVDTRAPWPLLNGWEDLCMVKARELRPARGPRVLPWLVFLRGYPRKPRAKPKGSGMPWALPAGHDR